jgi:D-amino peptidase
MEGVAGIVKWEQTTGGEPLYEEGRKLYTQEINAAVRGAKAAGATEIVVMDCHGAGKGWTFNSLVPEDLDPACEFVVQDEWTEYTEFLEQGCDAALFVGMHARAGTQDGVMNHTISGRDFQNLWFNGTLVGETGINAALCGTWGCPVLLVTGDEASCREGSELLGDGLTTVVVKRGFGSHSARNLPPGRARELIEAGARQTLSDLSAVGAYDPGSPCEIRVEYKHTDAAHALRYRAGVERVDARTIVSRADTWWEAWKQFYF